MSLKHPEHDEERRHHEETRVEHFLECTVSEIARENMILGQEEKNLWHENVNFMIVRGK